MCTVNSNCSIAEEFKSDDVVKITTETKDADVTEEVYIFWENQTNFDRELLGSQATSDIDFIPFHRVLKHSWEWFMS